MPTADLLFACALPQCFTSGDLWLASCIC